VSAGKIHVNTVFQRFNANNEPIGTYESLYISELPRACTTDEILSAGERFAHYHQLEN